VDLQLRDQVFLVSGGSRGLGLATAAQLVTEGAKVVLLGRSTDRLSAACALLGEEHALCLAGDLVDPELPALGVASAAARFGRLDGALISTGGPPRGKATSLDDDAWRHSFETDFLPPLRMARAVASTWSTAEEARDATTASARAVLMVLSSSAFRPLPNLGLSNGLRPGLANLVRELASEWGPAGIRINGIAPGRIDTDGEDTPNTRTGLSSAAERRSQARIPLGRYGEPAEFARVATFLLSPAASYLTGAIVPLDGGGAVLD
jgi:3-oxoacyl-[acyl-carrier protein] reductase